MLTPNELRVLKNRLEEELQSYVENIIDISGIHSHTKVINILMYLTMLSKPLNQITEKIVDSNLKDAICFIYTRLHPNDMQLDLYKKCISLSRKIDTGVFKTYIRNITIQYLKQWALLLAEPPSCATYFYKRMDKGLLNIAARNGFIATMMTSPQIYDFPKEEDQNNTQGILCKLLLVGSRDKFKFLSEATNGKHSKVYIKTIGVDAKLIRKNNKKIAMWETGDNQSWLDVKSNANSYKNVHLIFIFGYDYTHLIRWHLRAQMHCHPSTKFCYISSPHAEMLDNWESSTNYAKQNQITLFRYTSKTTVESVKNFVWSQYERFVHDAKSSPKNNAQEITNLTTITDQRTFFMQ